MERERAKPQASPDAAGGEVQIEILPLPVDKPEHEAQVKALAEKLSAEIQHGAANGATFESVAHAASLRPYGGRIFSRFGCPPGSWIRRWRPR